MIVKDEAPVIARCLESVKPFIDYWVIVDTGSIDGTQEIIRSILQDIPGELHEKKWVNFAYNRTEALMLARDKADYLFFIDADEIIVCKEGFKLPELTDDGYQIKVQFGGYEYARMGLIHNRLNWQWVGVLHEYVTAPQIERIGMLDGIYYVVYVDGHRSQNPRKYEDDIEVLEKALLDEPENSRYLFYLAQSYKDAGQYPEALEMYQAYLKKGSWDEELYWAMLQIGLLQKKIGYQPKVFLKTFQKAYEFRSSRLEALYQMVYYYRSSEKYAEGYELAKQGLEIQGSTDTLFIEKWIYDYGLLLEFSICAYWTQNYTEALLATYAILHQKNIPQSIKECAENNLAWIKSRLSNRSYAQN